MDATSLVNLNSSSPPPAPAEAAYETSDQDLFVMGKGAWLMDGGGKRYLDFVQASAANCLGHCSSVVKGALLYQSSRLITCNERAGNAPASRLRGALALRSGLDKAFFVEDGIKANAFALRLASKWARRRRAGASRIVVLGEGGNEDQLDGAVTTVPLNDLNALSNAMADDVAGVMLQPVQPAQACGASNRYLRDVRALTSSLNTLLIANEVETGMGRTGSLFAYQFADILPDIVTLGRGLGGGLPLAAVLATADVGSTDSDWRDESVCASPLMAAVGCAVLAKITKPHFLQAVEEKSIQLAGALRRLAEEYCLGEVIGRGLLLGVKVPNGSAYEIRRAARQRGLLIGAPAPDYLLMTPALNVTACEIQQATTILGLALACRTH